MTETDRRAGQLAKLREPFRSDEIGKLPRISCGKCSDAQGRCCGEHRKSKCATCGNWITSAHLHLDYVGHADITHRLLDADPEWTWEPVAQPAEQGLLCAPGGMWIRLTVAGVSRLGYGDAGQKKGGDAIKEVIGDALRNAAMRFGIALDLWAKGDRDWAKEGGASIDASPPTTPAPATTAASDDRQADQADAEAVRVEIAAFATQHGWDLNKIAAAFSHDHGVPIKQATVGPLRQFLGELHQDAQAEAGQVAS